MLCGGSCVCIRTYGTSLLYSRVCTHTKTVLNLNDAPETLLYRQARSAVVGAERAVLIGPDTWVPVEQNATSGFCRTSEVLLG